MNDPARPTMQRGDETKARELRVKRSIASDVESSTSGEASLMIDRE